ncbi:uncharacterized protein ACA1_088580 [Acanthamoeba castellanii str. Neff]|uniref:Uncharacterized protein n=1 Tax=Acanthamoeba castellanii (strain ATCC 30010 / Neff) TaxID=1257118 RepID=L8GVL0_ACACF|nr:uncharacterized protein ACA1_088580 [Acanthamoeba castellanii str. Neff]ELR16613.1 hypothetical protein ACA1_088580 [Acanthamoeba castellanii str. Neff]
MKKEARGGSDLPSPRKSKSDKKAEGKRKDAKKGKSKGGCHGGVRHMGFDRKNGFEIRNLPPEWEALFKGLNDTLKSLGAHGITKKEAQMLFAMASDALVPVPSTPAAAAAPAKVTDKQKKEEERKKRRDDEKRKTVLMNASGSIAATPDYLQLVKEKELLASEKQSWLRERETLAREKEALLRDRETWVKSKETAAAQAQKLQDDNLHLFQQLQDERKSRSQFEMENTQITQRLRISEYELGELKAQLSSKSSETESHTKRRDAEVLELMEKHEAVVQRKEQELTYEREYRSQLQDEKIQIENQMAQMRAEAKQVFETELEGIKKRLEDDMNQTKQLLKQEAEILTLKTRLEEQLENEREWEVERARLHDELKSLQEKGAEEAQRWLAKIGEAGERAIQLERDMRTREEQFERALEEKEEESRRKLEEARENIDRETKEKEDLKAQVAALQAAGPAHAHASPTSAAAVAPAAPTAPAVTSSGALAANSRDALLAAIKNPSALHHVSKEEKNDVAADDGNVLNIIARALLARRAAIKDEDENEDEELWE